MPAARAVVQPDLGRRTNRCDYHVQATVAVQVSHRRAAMATGRLCDQTGFGGERLEPDAAWVTWHAARNVPKHRIRLLHLHSRRVSQRLHVAARHEYILPAIVVEIGNGRRIPRHRYAEPGHAAAPGDIAEAALPKVPEQRKRDRKSVV